MYGAALQRRSNHRFDRRAAGYYFYSTRFEIRELLDDGRRRGDEWAQEARKVEGAEDIEAVSRPTPSPQQISLEELIPRWPTRSERNARGMVPNVAGWTRWSM
jgi:hypothetical protein